MAAPLFRLCGWLEEPAAGLRERDIEIAISVLFCFFSLYFHFGNKSGAKLVHTVCYMVFMRLLLINHPNSDIWKPFDGLPRLYFLY